MFVQIKTKEEIEGFIEAGRITAIIMDELLKRAIPDITTKSLDSLANNLCSDFKVIPAFLGYRGFPATICASVNKELVHGIPNDKTLQEGDILKIDIGINKNGFIGDMARTIKVGKEPDKLLLDCCFALKCGIAAAKAGNDIGDIADEISKVAKKGNWGVVGEYGGHGINRNQLHADPFVENIKSGYRPLFLRPGMVLAIEPMFVAGHPQTSLAADNWTISTNGMSAHFEDTIIISETEEPLIITRS